MEMIHEIQFGLGADPGLHTYAIEQSELERSDPIILTLSGSGIKIEAIYLRILTDKSGIKVQRKKSVYKYAWEDLRMIKF